MNRNSSGSLWFQWSLGLVSSAIWLTELCAPVPAQLVPDTIFGSRSSTVHHQGDRETIQGGIRAGSNLFHSFSEFNVGRGRSVYFSDPGVTNILTRVTGRNSSKIDGKLGVEGNANLFLLNPNGILFGANASLDIRGSFVATTAKAIQFSDGSEFGTTDLVTQPLLTIAVPIGLQRGRTASPAPIANQGQLTVGQNLTLAADRLELQGRLQAGRDLTLLAADTVQVRDTPTQPFLAQAGRDLTIQGDRGIDILALNHSTHIPVQSGGNLSLISDGVISADARFLSQGNFQVRSLSGGLATVTSRFDPIITTTGDVDLALNYTGASLLIEAGGNVRIQGTVDITTPDGAAPFIGDDTILNRQAGLIVRSGQSTLRYTNPNGVVPGSTTGTGIVPNPGITLQGAVTTVPNGVVRLTADQGGSINTQSIGTLQGAITLTSAADITTNGQLLNVGTDSGNAGTIRLTAPKGNIAVGNLLAYSDDDVTFGNGGAITVTAGGSVTADAISTWSTFGAGGDLSITAGQAIAVQDLLTYSYFGDNDSGDVTLNSGSTVSFNHIDSSSENGLAGDVRITAPSDITATGITDVSTYGSGQGGQMTVQAGGDIRLLRDSVWQNDTFASGNAGDTSITARSLFLTDGAQIRSSSRFEASGDSGNITINVLDRTQLSGVGSGDRPSAIFSFADLYSTGNGGNITLNTGSLTMRDGSEILANHFGEGVGTRAGDITIRATGLISLAGFRVRTEEKDSPGTGIASNVTSGFNSTRGINRQGGTIDIQAGGLELLNGGYISSSLESKANGQGGNIRLNLTNQGIPGNLLIAGSATRESGIFSRTIAESIGNGSNIQINAGNLSLQKNAVISAETVTAGNAGEITLLIDRLTVTDGGQIRTSTSGAGQAGSITLGTATQPIDQVTLSGRNSAILANTEPETSGNGGNIAVFAKDLFLTNQARISTETAGQGKAGNVTVQATGTVNLANGTISTGVARNATGNGGDLTVSARSLALTNRGRIQTLTRGVGDAGDIQIQVAEGLTIADNFSGIVSGSSTPTERSRGVGDGGNIHLTADTLQILNEGLVSASTFSDGRSGNIDVIARVVELTNRGGLSATTESRGDAGDITVNARDRILISGNSSGLFANTGWIGGRQATGDGGNIVLNTGELLMQSGARINVGSRGLGRGGDIYLFAQQVTLDDRATIFAETASTQGGNIQMQVRDLLLLRHNSLISASAGTAQAGGNGGNIRINAGFVVGVLRENSDITANAFTGNGGRIDITTQGIFGLQFQPRLTPWSDITASSQFGINGIVTLNTPNVDPSRGLVQLPADVTDSSNQIVQTCSAQERRNSFVMTGRGGVSPDPTEALNQTGVWSDRPQPKIDRQPDQVRQTDVNPAPSSPPPTEIIEATGWIQHEDASISLMAGAEAARSQLPVSTCPGYDSDQQP
ncbi:filamentous hemagglutinin N-terminal domain-containing protein [Pantanalinema sp. GBBB05]|uniref:two-partner secretion domain-containing protein n=1 Tax=Pantanalinema sp. GBBB05 TaxID=2604139 RepID=UPI001D5890A6|nr:filamentous hemagglutinin N-terminal domain-containing protein [Pantanalinema sp. GBBB05]